MLKFHKASIKAAANDGGVFSMVCSERFRRKSIKITNLQKRMKDCNIIEQLF